MTIGLARDLIKEYVEIKLSMEKEEPKKKREAGQRVKHASRKPIKRVVGGRLFWISPAMLIF